MREIINGIFYVTQSNCTLALTAEWLAAGQRDLSLECKVRVTVKARASRSPRRI
jgi:hypothetical protein